MFVTMLSGWLGADAEFKYTEQGTAYIRLRVGVNAGKEKDTLWVSVVCFGPQAERLAGFNLRKGTKVEVASTRAPEVEAWQSKAGNMGVNFTVIADRVDATKNINDGGE